MAENFSCDSYNISQYRINSDGYRIIHNHNGNPIRAHRMIMEHILGRKLNKDEVVHHIDGNKFNNLPSNLQIITWAEHCSIHHSGKHHSKETRRKMSMSAIGKPKSLMHRKNLSISHLGHSPSKKTREKHRVIMLRIWKERKKKECDSHGR